MWHAAALVAAAVVLCAPSASYGEPIPATATPAPSLMCAHTLVRATNPTEWRAMCDGGVAFTAFEPSSVANYFLAHDAAVRMIPSATKPTDVYLSAGFHRVEALASATLKTFSLKAEPLWVHKTPVVIAAAAFAQLTALETLILQDIPLMNTSLHLQLPRSIKKIQIVGCKIQRFSFEIVGGGSPTFLREVDLHTNDLVEIPEIFYSLPTDVTNLDIRLNQLSSISVASSHAATLEQWMKKGVLQIDNLKTPCAHAATQKKVQGLSQVFDVCVLPDASSGSTATKSPLQSSSAEGIAGEGDTMPPAATVRTPSDESMPPSTRTTDTSKEQEAVSKSVDKRSKPQTMYVALIAAAAVTALLAIVAAASSVARSRHASADKVDSQSRGAAAAGGKTRSSLMMMSAVTEDLESFGYDARHSRRSSSSASSDSMMITPLPDFSNHTRAPRANLPERAVANGAAPATPITGRVNAMYATLATPIGKSDGYMMSKSLQTLTGVSDFSIASSQKRSELRRANKQRLRALLGELAQRRGTFEVNKSMFVCFDKVTESQAGALMVRCQPATNDAAPLFLKVYVEQDIQVAIREYRALLVMQSNTCKQFVSQMVATEMEKQMDDGLKCAVIVVEMGSATTFRHIVRGQIDRTKQFAVVQQLHQVIKALECLHERQFMHGGLTMDALVTHSAEANRLKFRDLEHATRFGDTIQGLFSSDFDALEYVPPEMAKHLLCSNGETPRSTMVVHDVVEDDTYAVLRASAAFDVWCFGVVILKMYATSKQLDEFDGCKTPMDVYLKLSDDKFDFERSLKLYVYHEDVRDLARGCLRRDPRARPKIAGILSHRVFRAYDRLEESALVASFTADRMKAANKTREVLPPTLWFFLPPRDLGLAKTRSIETWINDITSYQEQQRQVSRFRSSELMFPLLFLCEDSHHTSTPCAATGAHHTRLHVPASLLSLAMPLVQETTLFLEAKSILSNDPPLNIAEASGLGVHQWNELMKFYRALERMRLAPISSFSVLLLKPLEEMLAAQDKQQARQVLDELKCLIFSQEKRDHILSLLDILKTISINAELDGPTHDEQEEEEDEEEEVSGNEDGGDELGSRRASKEWARLRKCEVDTEASTSMPITRWLCRRHWECEMECEV